jgi:hypothetical protein
MGGPNRAKASAAYGESSPIGCRSRCVIGITSRARDQPGRRAPLPQLPGQIVGVLDGLCGVLPPSPPPVSELTI